MTEAKGYGGALFELAEESGRTEVILENLKTVELAFVENPKYKTLLDTPALSKEERLSLIESAFVGADEYVLNVIKMLCEKRNVHLFGEIVKDFCARYDEARGIERVEAVTAVAMTDEQVGAMKSRLEAITGKTVVHTTSAGTQGIANATGADEILTGSLVNAAAIAEYIRKSGAEEVSLVCMGLEGKESTREDTLCAEYIKALLEGTEIDLAAGVEECKRTSGAKFFDKAQSEVFPEADFWLSTEADRFDLVLGVELGEDGFMHTRKKA